MKKITENIMRMFAISSPVLEVSSTISTVSIAVVSIWENTTCALHKNVATRVKNFFIDKKSFIKLFCNIAEREVTAALTL